MRTPSQLPEVERIRRRADSDSRTDFEMAAESVAARAANVAAIGLLTRERLVSARET